MTVEGGAKRRTTRSSRKPTRSTRKTTKKPVRPSKKMSDMTVVELRKLAKRKGVKQTKRDGSNKNKSELIRSINRAK